MLLHARKNHTLGDGLKVIQGSAKGASGSQCVAIAAPDRFSTQPYSGPTEIQNRRRVEAYYRECWRDYRWFWCNPSNYALHFGFWDRDTRTHTESLETMNRFLSEHARFSPGERALDAGCGVGGTAVWVAKRFDIRVSGVTVNRDHIARGRQYVRDNALERSVSFSLQDHSELGFDSGTFDVVYSIESMCYAPDKRTFLAEALRVLRPMGRLVVLDGFMTDTVATFEDRRLLDSWLSGWAVPHLAHPDEAVGWARALGFTDVTFRNLTHDVRRSARRLGRVAATLFPIAVLLRGLRMRSEVQHGNVRAARDQWRALKRGLWSYGMLYAVKPQHRVEIVEQGAL